MIEPMTPSEPGSQALLEVLEGHPLARNPSWDAREGIRHGGSYGDAATQLRGEVSIITIIYG